MHCTSGSSKGSSFQPQGPNGRYHRLPQHRRGAAAPQSLCRGFIPCPDLKIVVEQCDYICWEKANQIHSKVFAQTAAKCFVSVNTYLLQELISIFEQAEPHRMPAPPRVRGSPTQLEESRFAPGSALLLHCNLHRCHLGRFRYDEGRRAGDPEPRAAGEAQARGYFEPFAFSLP